MRQALIMRDCSGCSETSLFLPPPSEDSQGPLMVDSVCPSVCMSLSVVTFLGTESFHYFYLIVFKDYLVTLINIMCIKWSACNGLSGTCNKYVFLNHFKVLSAPKCSVPRYKCTSIFKLQIRLERVNYCDQ